MNNYHMTSFIFIPLLLVACGKEPRKPNIPAPQPPQQKEYTFATTPSWADEFDYQGLPDDDKWGYDVGSQNGSGNNELQFYPEKRPENARVAVGVFHITALKEALAALAYTTARPENR